MWEGRVIKMKMDITVKSINKENSATKAFVDINFADAVSISGFRIFQYTNKQNEVKMGVAMPQRKNANGEYTDLCKPVTAEFRKELERNVFMTYNPDEKQTQKSFGENGNDTYISARVNEIRSSIDVNAKAMCSLKLDDCFAIDSIVLKENPNTGKIFVSSPSRQYTDKQGEKKYSSIYEFDKKTAGIILKEYKNSIEKKGIDSVIDNAKNADRNNAEKTVESKEPVR